MTNYMIINGTRYPVINAWVETEANDGRKRWGIVTEAEVQSAPPAEATAVGEPFRGSLASAMGITQDQHGATWGEPASGPPVRLADGPGCTPVEVPQVDTGEPVRAGSLYSDKCAECTTGHSCESARRCLFDG